MSRLSLTFIFFIFSSKSSFHTIFQSTEAIVDSTDNIEEEYDMEPRPEDSLQEERGKTDMVMNSMQNKSKIEQLEMNKYSSEEANMSKDNKNNHTMHEPTLSNEVVMVLQEQTGWVCNGSVCTDLGPIYDRQTPSAASNGNI